MTLPDNELSGRYVLPAALFFADFADEPIRGCYAPGALQVPAGLSGDADCDGFVFEAVDSDVLRIAPVSQEDGGTGTFQFTLFADPANSALLTAIENPSLYLGRRVRVWLATYNEQGVVLSIKGAYRGYMTVPGQRGSADEFIITMEAENWASLFSAGQGRTYMQSTIYDAGDAAGAVLRGQTGANAPFVDLRPGRDTYFPEFHTP
jgi:hypothetical protein